MIDINSKLESFDNKKLIDIVKNYRQYGYGEKLRNIAIEILDKRGIDKEQLKLTGNLKNSTYESAERIHNSYSRNSKITLIFYVIILISNILVSIFAQNSEILASIILIINGVALISFIIFLIKSFINQSEFYKAIGKDNDSNGIIIYFFIGMPFYIIAYFYFRNQMNDEMKLIK